MSGLEGCLTVSLSGRDAGMICVIIREEEDLFFVADGRGRRVENPKKKNRKHVRVITGENGEPIRFSGTLLTNRFLRKWLREYAGGVQV